MEGLGPVSFFGYKLIPSRSTRFFQKDFPRFLRLVTWHDAHPLDAGNKMISPAAHYLRRDSFGHYNQ